MGWSPARAVLGKGPKGYLRSDDRIREDAGEALYRAGDLDASDMTVEVKDGEVVLDGTVPDRRSSGSPSIWSRVFPESGTSTIGSAFRAEADVGTSTMARALLLVIPRARQALREAP